MKNKGLGELINACKEVLNVSREHSYLWDDASLWDDYNKDKTITLFGGFIAQDEYYRFNIVKHNNRLGFRASDWCEDELIFDPRQAASIINRYSFSADKLRKNFYKGLKEPLGRYLANKYIKDRLK